MCWVPIMPSTGNAWRHRFHNREAITMRNKKSKFAALFQEYPDVVLVPQLCKMLGVCKGNAYQLLHSGQIKHLRVGLVYRIPKTLCHWFSGKGNTGSKVGYGCQRWRNSQRVSWNATPFESTAPAKIIFLSDSPWYTPRLLTTSKVFPRLLCWCPCSAVHTSEWSVGWLRSV